jgi:hypothetical protein
MVNMNAPDTSPQGENNELSAPQIIRDLFSQIWNPELLISTFAIFILIKVPDWITELKYNLAYDYGFQYLSGTDFAVLFFNAAIYILLLTFILHLILRSYWVGLIGLQYVFRGGIHLKKLSYRPAFNRYILNHTENLEDHEQKIDRISSAFFSFGFLCFFAIIGVMMFWITMMIILNLSSKYEDGNMVTGPAASLGALLYILLGILYLIDFITLGSIKKIKGFSAVYFPVYWYFSLITLSFIYRPLYYTFLTNMPKWKFGLILGLFVSASFGIGISSIWSQRVNYPFDPAIRYDRRIANFSYDNLRAEQDRTELISIPSDIVTGNYMRLFVNRNYMFMFSNDGRARYSKLSSKNIDSIFRVWINDSLYSGLKFMNFEYPDRKGKGLVTYIPTATFRRGENRLKVEANTIWGWNKSQSQFATLHFWFEKE